MIRLPAYTEATVEFVGMTPHYKAAHYANASNALRVPLLGEHASL